MWASFIHYHLIRLVICTKQIQFSQRGLTVAPNSFWLRGKVEGITKNDRIHQENLMAISAEIFQSDRYWCYISVSFYQAAVAQVLERVSYYPHKVR